MPRPCKARKLNHFCNFSHFWPISWNEEKIDFINPDEIESIKLADLEWLSMIEWGRIMWISAPTFFRILQKARKKLANSLINWTRLEINNISNNNFLFFNNKIMPNKDWTGPNWAGPKTWRWAGRCGGWNWQWRWMWCGRWIPK